MFYIYEHTRKDTGLPFYVGKGKGYRAASKQNRNVYWKRVVAKAGGYEIRYVAKDLDEELAYLCEQERIDQLKRLGIKLTNLTVGGEGAGGGELHHMYGKPHPQKGVKRPWLSERYMGDKNPMWGKPSAMRGVAKPKGKDSPLYGRKRPEGGGKKPQPVVAEKDGKEVKFNSIADATSFMNCKRWDIRKACNKEQMFGGYIWKYFKEQL